MSSDSERMQILQMIEDAQISAAEGLRRLHIRVQRAGASTDGPRHIALSFPLPIRLTAWALRLAGPHIPQLKDSGIDELILALAETTSAESPLYVDVNEGEGGEHVHVYIG